MAEGAGKQRQHVCQSAGSFLQGTQPLRLHLSELCFSYPTCAGMAPQGIPHCASALQSYMLPKFTRSWPKQSHTCHISLSCVCCMSPVLQLYMLSSFQEPEAGTVSRFVHDVWLICCNACKAKESEDCGASLRLLEHSIFSDRMVFVRAAHEAKWLSEMELSIYESWCACLYVVMPVSLSSAACVFYRHKHQVSLLGVASLPSFSCVYIKLY